MTITITLSEPTTAAALAAFATQLPDSATTEDRENALLDRLSNYIVDVIHGNVVESAVAALRITAEAAIAAADYRSSISATAE